MSQRLKVFFWSGTNPISKSIQRVTKSKWSHCGFVIDESTIIDSDWTLLDRGVKKRYFRYLKKPKQLEIVDLNFDDDTLLKIRKKCLEYVGKSYDIPLIFSFVLEYFKGHKRFSHVRGAKKSFVCSEFIADVIFSVTNDKRFMYPETIYPGELYELLR